MGPSSNHRAPLSLCFLAAFTCVSLLAANAEPYDPQLASKIDSYLASKKSPIQGNGAVFVAAGLKYNVDPRLIVAIAGQESSFGTSWGCFKPSSFNAWSWFWAGGGDCVHSIFQSYADGIQNDQHGVTQGIHVLYLTRGRNTIATIGQAYCTSGCGNWTANVTKFYTDLGGNPSDLTYSVPVPTCTLSATPSTITAGDSTTLSWTSANATSASVNGVGALSPVAAGSRSLSPSQSTTYVAVFTGPGGSAQCSAQVTVNPIQGILQVFPGANLAFAGNQGGPYLPSSIGFQLSASVGSVKYSITGLPNWLTVSSLSGTLTTTPVWVTFSLNSNANSIAPATYIAGINFVNTSNNRGTQTRTATLIVNPVPSLQVSPASQMVFSGHRGGPFVPQSISYSVSVNTGAAFFVISGYPTWLTVSPTSGFATNVPTTVTFTVSPNAKALASGTYLSTISFTNTLNGRGTQARSATIQVK
jgi:hypothetical protein